MTPRINGVHHVALNVKDLDRAERFYTNVLGFTVTHRFSTGLRHIMVDTGNSHLALFEAPELDIDQAIDQISEVGYQHLAFGADRDHFDALVTQLKEHISEIDGPVQRGKGRSIYFNDPDGNHLEVHSDEP